MNHVEGSTTITVRGSMRIALSQLVCNFSASVVNDFGFSVGWYANRAFPYHASQVKMLFERFAFDKIAYDVEKPFMCSR